MPSLAGPALCSSMWMAFKTCCDILLFQQSSSLPPPVRCIYAGVYQLFTLPLLGASGRSTDRIQKEKKFITIEGFRFLAFARGTMPMISCTGGRGLAARGITAALTTAFKLVPDLFVVVTRSVSTGRLSLATNMLVALMSVAWSSSGSKRCHKRSRWSTWRSASVLEEAF